MWWEIAKVRKKRIMQLFKTLYMTWWKRKLIKIGENIEIRKSVTYEIWFVDYSSSSFSSLKFSFSSPIWVLYSQGIFAFLHFSFPRTFVTYLIFKWKVNVVESELFPHFIRLRRHHQLIVSEKSILKKFEVEISRNSNWISWQRKNCCEYQFDGDHFRNARGCEERGGKRNDKFSKRKEGIHRNRLKTLQEWAFSTLCIVLQNEW